MEYYLFTARSVTHAQRMARALSEAGIPAKIRRAGAALTGRGCGYTLAIEPRGYLRAREVCLARNVLPTRVLHVKNGETREVAP